MSRNMSGKLFLGQKRLPKDFDLLRLKNCNFQQSNYVEFFSYFAFSIGTKLWPVKKYIGVFWIIKRRLANDKMFY